MMITPMPDAVGRSIRKGEVGGSRKVIVGEFKKITA